MLQLFGQMIKLPMEVLAFSMDMLVKTMQGVQQIAFQGIDMLAERGDQTFDDPSPREYTVQSPVSHDVPISTIGDRTDIPLQTPQKEEAKMPDKNLSGKDLKLVRYKILFIKRDYEHAFDEQEELVHDDMNESSYAAWKVAEFIQQLGRYEIKVPKNWKTYPKDYRKEKNEVWYLTGFPEDDKRYLRVYFEVLDRYKREPLDYEEEQLKVLRELRDGVNVIGKGIGPASLTESE